MGLGLGLGLGLVDLHRLMRLGFYGTCFAFGLFALPLSGAGLTFFAAAKKVSKESSFPTPILAGPRQTAPSEWSNRGSVVSGVSSLLAPRRRRARRTAIRSGTALIHPASRYALARQVKPKRVATLLVRAGCMLQFTA